MAEKSPVTLLQELAHLKKLSTPVYTFEEIEGPKFKCTVQVAGKTAVGIATTKRMAKSESAQIALRDFMTEKPSTNHVGELSEYAAKRHVEHPVYECLPTTLKSGEFIVNCSFLGCAALGKGKSKKEAKQNAAKNMIELYLSKGEFLIETPNKAKEEGEKITAKEKSGDVSKAEKSTKGAKAKDNTGKSNKSKENSGEDQGDSSKEKKAKKKSKKKSSQAAKTVEISGGGQVGGLGAQDLEKIVATINTLGLKEGKSGSGSKPSQIQIVINLEK